MNDGDLQAQPRPAVAPLPAPPAPRPVPRFDSARLFGGGREFIIEHGGREYRMRITASGKLILTA